MTRLSCHRFRSNEVRLWLSVIAHNLGNLWRRLALPKKIENWSLTSLQQGLVQTGRRLVTHARYYSVLLAESHLTKRLFAVMVRRMEALPLPAGRARQPGETNLDDGGEFVGEVCVKWISNQASHGFWPRQRTYGDDKVLAVGMKWEKGGEPGTRGYILRWLSKQKWKFRITADRAHMPQTRGGVLQLVRIRGEGSAAYGDQSMSCFKFRISNLSMAKSSARLLRASSGLLCLFVLAMALPSSAQNVNLFPPDAEAQWTRIAIPPTHPPTDVAQWHIDAAKHQIVCDGNGGHDWLRFNKELRNFTYHVKWRFTPVTTGKPKYNSGVFFRNDSDGNIKYQAEVMFAGGFIWGVTPVDGKLQRFSLQKEMTENRVKPAGQWNVYDIRCVGDTCTLAVNGVQVSTAHVGVEKGYIGLEAEGYRIEFKDFKVKELR